MRALSQLAPICKVLSRPRRCWKSDHCTLLPQPCCRVSDSTTLVLMLLVQRAKPNLWAAAEVTALVAVPLGALLPHLGLPPDRARLPSSLRQPSSSSALLFTLRLRPWRR